MTVENVQDLKFFTLDEVLNFKYGFKSSNVGLIGGGFSLYAWLPALCEHYQHRKIGIQERHKLKFDSRPELQKYKDRIIWFGMVEDIIENSELLILSIPPNEVYSYLPTILQSKTLKRLIVDKPICPTPELSESFIKVVEGKGIQICSAYIFFYTDWFKKLEEAINNPKNKDKNLQIEWCICSKNHPSSWKWEHNLGGGPLRFYGIHLISIMAYFGYEIDFGYKNIDRCSLCFFKDESRIEVQIIQDSQFPRFRFWYRGDYDIFNGVSPFPEKLENSSDDIRIEPLQKLLTELNTNGFEGPNELMKQTNELWKQIEQKLS